MREDVTVHRVVKDRKEPGQFIEPHRHTFFHFIFSLGGCARVRAGEADFVLERDGLAMIPPGVEHAIYSLDRSSSLSIKFACSPGLEARAAALPLHLPRVGEYEKELIKNLFEEAVSQRGEYAEMVSLRLYELLILLERAVAREEGGWRLDCLPPDPARSRRLRRALEMIETQVEAPLRVADVAAACGYNENYFSAFFREHVGCTPRRYINLQKIARAKDLMLFSDLNVTQIAERLGFESIHYFSRLFKQVTGLSPTQYMGHTRQDLGINVVRNQNTPPGAFEIPLRDPDQTQ